MHKCLINKRSVDVEEITYTRIENLQKRVQRIVLNAPMLLVYNNDIKLKIKNSVFL